MARRSRPQPRTGLHGSVLGQALRLARPFWTSRLRWQALALLAATVGLTLGIVFIEVWLNAWQGEFYNALQAKDRTGFWRLMLQFGGIATALIAATVYRQYLSQLLQIRWREQMTRRLLDTWFGGHLHYRLQLSSNAQDNPDQRIADDVAAFVGDSLSLALGLLNATVTLVSFVGILWVLSGPVSFGLGGMRIDVPGYLVWVALAYALLGSWLTRRVGRPLAALNFAQQRVEADFRFGLARVREYGESIALQGGERAESRAGMQRLAEVVGNALQVMRRQKRLTSLTASYGQVATVFPYLAAAPKYFSGSLTLGALMQSASAFGQVQGALSWFVNAYGAIASWRATVERLAGFEHAAAEIARHGGGPVIRHSDRQRIVARGLCATLRDGTPLRVPGELQVLPGESLLIEGPSGVGKSTLLRLLAGLWPYGQGCIELPAQALRFVPQKPYLPIGTLREALAYPDPAASLDDAAAHELLRLTGLQALQPELDHADRWHLRLSLGEQQRIGLAQVLRAQPRWLLLDEATSALDVASEAALYRLLQTRLPGAAIISVGHRPSLRQFHRRRLVLGSDPAWRRAGTTVAQRTTQPCPSGAAA